MAAGVGMTYLARLPVDAAEIPATLVVAHNHVRPRRRLNVDGFRAWLQAPGDEIEPCPCG
jgi:hypothetical protein